MNGQNVTWRRPELTRRVKSQKCACVTDSTKLTQCTCAAGSSCQCRIFCVFAKVPPHRCREIAFPGDLMASRRSFLKLWPVIIGLCARGDYVAGQRTCTVPCVHRLHPYDIVPCTHPCQTPYGIAPCHPAGDIVPCVHPVHPYGDIVYC